MELLKLSDFMQRCDKQIKSMGYEMESTFQYSRQMGACIKIHWLSDFF